MKYKKIVSLCKEEKTVVSSASDSGKLTWFGTNKALYPAYGLSVMTANEILRMNDVPEDKLYILRETSAGLRYIVVLRGLTPLAVLIPQKVPVPDMLYMESSMIARTARCEIESKQEDAQAEQTTL